MISLPLAVILLLALAFIFVRSIAWYSGSVNFLSLKECKQNIWEASQSVSQSVNQSISQSVPNPVTYIAESWKARINQPNIL